MMDKSYKAFEKKIIPYLDGALTADDRSEFEAFVSTHPEFESVIQKKKKDIDLLKNMIPQATPTSQMLESLETEMKASVFNLLKEEPQTLTERMKLKWEEWSSR